MQTQAGRLVPGKGCFVAHRDAGLFDGQLGVVVQSDRDTLRLQVQWRGNGGLAWHGADELRNGFRKGHVVQDRPRSNTRTTLGTGTVVAHREIAGREMVLVQLHRTGESRWLPFERLVRVRDAGWKYSNAAAADPELFRLKVLAYALDSWNQVTGSLDRLDVDPLPHQIDLVHRIMTSDHTNWLIADDVGLGKTIEVGLLLAAMKRRRLARRVLVVCPAGVVRQWQDEMRFKFGEDFRIYGLDFNIGQPAHWVSFDKVIVSIDRAKSDAHSTIFGDSGFWDVIVFDEAHHLSKIEGAAVTQRYRLAERLQGFTDSLIFLTGTPHQGKTDQFVNVLLLLRPDLKSRLGAMFSDPSVVGEVVLLQPEEPGHGRLGQLSLPRAGHEPGGGAALQRGQGLRLAATPLHPPRLHGIGRRRCHRARRGLCHDDLPQARFIEHCRDRTGAPPAPREADRGTGQQLEWDCQGPTRGAPGCLRGRRRKTARTTWLSCRMTCRSWAASIRSSPMRCRCWEAGGEGINLHYNCYMLVNYDLPWNPRRLVQRAGRLYRYGQTERVVVFNLVGQDGFDNKALGMLLNRVSTIARDMSDVSSEFHEGLEIEIVGALLERVDIAQILANNRDMENDQGSEAEIDEAIERAKQSQSLQDELFAHIEGYDPNATAAVHTFGPEEVLSFLEGVLPCRGCWMKWSGKSRQYAK